MRAAGSNAAGRTARVPSSEPCVPRQRSSRQPAKQLQATPFLPRPMLGAQTETGTECPYAASSSLMPSASPHVEDKIDLPAPILAMTLGRHSIATSCRHGARCHNS